MSGKLSHELEMNVPASQAWELYGSLELARLVQRELSTVIQTIDVLEGDGGVGTILKLNFAPGSGFEYSKEKFTSIDNEKRIKVAEVIEGGYFTIGFSMYKVTFEVMEKGQDSCILKSTIEYDVKEEHASNASLVTIDVFANIAEAAKHYLTKRKN